MRNCTFSTSSTSLNRSWVSGRSDTMPCWAKAIAVASTAPIQMGRYRSPCALSAGRSGCWTASRHGRRRPPSAALELRPRTCSATPGAIPTTGDAKRTEPLFLPNYTRYRPDAERSPGASRARLRVVYPDAAAVMQVRPRLSPSSTSVACSRAMCAGDVVRRAQRGLAAALLPGQRRDRLLDQGGLPLGGGLDGAQVARLDAVLAELHRATGARKAPGCRRTCARRMRP